MRKTTLAAAALLAIVGAAGTMHAQSARKFRETVTVEGRARAVSTLPIHRGTRNCGGGSVYDSQIFVLQDKSGTIGISTAGTCRPNVTKPVVQNERLRIRGVVMADGDDPGGTPLIHAHSIDRVTP